MEIGCGVVIGCGLVIGCGVAIGCSGSGDGGGVAIGCGVMARSASATAAINNRLARLVLGNGNSGVAAIGRLWCGDRM